MTTFRFFCRLADTAGARPCGDFKARLLLAAVHAFARQRGFLPADVAWLGDTFFLGRLRFRVEAVK